MKGEGRREKGEDEGGRAKKFPSTKSKGLILKSENKLFLLRKEDDPRLFGEEIQ